MELKFKDKKAMHEYVRRLLEQGYTVHGFRKNGDGTTSVVYSQRPSVPTDTASGHSAT